MIESNENNNKHEQTLSNTEAGQVYIEHIDLPNATAVLVLGILSIVFCWCYGIIGTILGIIALVLANKDLKLYKENPRKYSESSYKNLNAGRVTAIIGLSLSALFLLYLIVVIALYGTLVISILESSGEFPY
jgi:hypothetical protein